MSGFIFVLFSSFFLVADECHVMVDELSSVAAARELQDLQQKIYTQLEKKGISPETLRVSDLAESGVPVTEQNLRAIGVPDELVHLYDSKGKLKLGAVKGHKLSAENGDRRLTGLRINIDPQTDPDLLLVDDYTRLLAAQPKLDLVVAVAPKDLKLIQKKIASMDPGLRKRVKLVPVTSEKGLVPWAHDGGKPAYGSNLLPRGAISRPDSMSPYNLSGHLDVERELGVIGKRVPKKSLARFEGGDLVVGDKHVFMGADAISSNQADLKVSRAETLKFLEKQFGKPIVEVGRTRSSRELARPRSIDYHVDLTMSVLKNKETGKDQVMLNSPTRLLELVGSGKRMRGVPSLQKTKALLANAKRSLHQSSDRSRKNLLHLLNTIEPERLHRQIVHYERFKKKLRSLNYSVIDLPGIGNEDAAISSPKFFGYTNSVASTDYVILPRSNVAELDQEVRAIYQQAGYDSFFMHSAPTYFCKRGGPRCATQAYRN